VRSCKIVVSDPWVFQDQNDGKSSFSGEIIDTIRDKYWIVKLNESMTFEGQDWTYVIPLTRHSNQRYFDDPSEHDRSANVVLITDAEAGVPEMASMRLDEVGPFVIGTVDLI
jgi:hypothetical protein